MRETGWEERGPKAHPKNSDFGTLVIWVLFSGLPTHTSEEHVRIVTSHDVLSL